MTSLTIYGEFAIATFDSDDERIDFIKAHPRIKRRYRLTKIWIPNEDRIFRL